MLQEGEMTAMDIVTTQGVVLTPNSAAEYVLDNIFLYKVFSGNWQLL